MNIQDRLLKLPRGVRHSIWSVLDAAVYPVVYLATVPIMLRSMGMVNFGLWILLNSIITIFQLLNFNSGVANLGVPAIRNISYAIANNDTQHALDIINTLFRLTFILLAIALSIGFGLSFVAVKLGWWGINDAPGNNVSLCIILAVAVAGLKYFDQLFQSIIKAYERFKLSAILNMIYRFGSLGITLILAVSRYTLANILFANVVFILLYLVAQFVCVKRIMPIFKIGRAADKYHYGKLLNFSFWPWIQSLMIVITFQTDRFWVSAYSGLTVVSCYGLVSTMFNHIHMIFTAMVVWMMPRIATMTSKGDDPARIYQVVRGYLFGIIVVSLLFFYFLSPYLFSYYVGVATYMRMAPYIKGFVAFEIVFAHTIMPFFYLNAAGKERLAAKATMLYCGVCYALMLGGLWLFRSPVAMVGGMTIAMCVTMPFINAIVQRQMHHIYSGKLAILEMLPMYTAILLIYSKDTIWAYWLLIPVILVLLWKYYLKTIFKHRIWQQAS